MNCRHCEEPILDIGEARQVQGLAGPEFMHYECLMRMAIGPVAHLDKRCSCFVPGSEEFDPPGMTRRQAAVAAVRRWRELNWH